LLNVLHVLGRLVELEGLQQELLAKICSGPTIAFEELKANETLTVPAAWRKKLATDSSASPSLFPTDEEQ
jgi:hypothetical protein